MLNVHEVGYETDGKEIFSNIDFNINPKDRIGLIGDNGVGKSLLLKILVGDIQPTSGEIINPERLRIGLMPQDFSTWLDHTVYDFIEETTGVQEARNKFEEACNKLSTEKEDDNVLLIYQEAQDKYTQLEVYNFHQRLKKSLKKAGVGEIDTNLRLGEISGGQRTKIALAAIFADKHDLLLLDEPTNNLDQEGIIVLETYIEHSSASFVLVSHDRRFLRNASKKIIELLGGNNGVQEYTLGYDEYVEAKKNRYESDTHHHDQYVKKCKQIEKQIKKMNSNVVSVSSNRSRTDNDKLNTNFRKEKASNSISSRLTSLKTKSEQVKRVDPPEEPISLNFTFTEPEKLDSSNRLISVENLVIEYTHNNSISTIGPISFNIYGKERIALIGNNGSGKTSIINAVLGSNKFIKEGQIRLSPSIRIGYIDQNQSLPLMNSNALDNLRTLCPNIPQNEIMHLLVKFNIERQSITYTPAYKLSGGERAKIILAGIVANQSNIIILDEPTNNLDITTTDALETAISSYRGALLVVSHDREFIQNLSIEQTISIK